MGKPRIPSPKTCKTIGDRWFAKGEFRPATEEWEAAGKLPGVKPLDTWVPKPREFYYPEANLPPWEVQYDRKAPPSERRGKAKVPPSPQTRVREGEVQTREAAPEKGAQAISFESYAAHFAMSPEAQAMVERRVREDVERNAKRQREIEAKKVADEIERREKEKIEKELKEATAAKLREHRRPQQGERVEYEVFRVGTDDTQPWPSDDEVRATLKKESHGVWDPFRDTLYA